MRARKMIHQVGDFAALLGRGAHFDQGQVAQYCRLVSDVLHIDHIDQFIQVDFHFPHVVSGSSPVQSTTIVIRERSGLRCARRSAIRC